MSKFIFARYKNLKDVQETLLYIHSWLRWIFLILAVWVIIKSATGWRTDKKFDTDANKLSLFLMITADIMFLIGMLQYWMYYFPDVMKKLSMSEIMKNSGVRIIAIEHITLMVLSWIFIHVARSSSKKAQTDSIKYKRLFIWVTAALILALAGIPWGGDRPMFRF